MILKKLKALFTKRQNDKDGKAHPSVTAAINECYAEFDTKNRWQGDIYPYSSFETGSLPTQDVPYWMLLNRTCQLVENDGRQVKIPYLNFAAVYPIKDFISTSGNALVKNQVSSIVKGQNENTIFLPAFPGMGVNVPLVANFNLIYTINVSSAPRASQKLLQLSSPFCEHVFQKFSRYFYTVGFDDKNIKSKDYIEDIVSACQPDK